MESQVKISVIIPVYNVEQYLPKCLASVVQQTLADIEIICINDDSTDNSLNILNEYASKDSRIKVITQTNTSNGAGSARNKGLDVAQGEYISFIDSDDYIEENFLKKMYETAKNYNADVACCGVIKEKGKEQIVQLKFNDIKVSDNPNDNLMISKSLPFPYPWNKIYKREFIINYGIKFEENIFYEDLIFTPLVITKAEKLISVPNVFYHYIERPNSVTMTDSHIKNSDKQKAFHIGKKYYLDAKINV